MSVLLLVDLTLCLVCYNITGMNVLACLPFDNICSVIVFFSLIAYFLLVVYAWLPYQLQILISLM